MSLALLKNVLPLSTTLVINHAEILLLDTDTDNKFIASVPTPVVNLPPISRAPAINLLLVSIKLVVNLSPVFYTAVIKHQKQLEHASPFKTTKKAKTFLFHISHPKNLL